MRRLVRPLTIAALLAVLGSAAARAAGYSIYEQGAAVLGMAGAGTASVHDASALFYNPAAIARAAGHTADGGRQHAHPGGQLRRHQSVPGYGVTEEMNAQNFFPANVYLTHKYNQQWAFGAGFNSPFGLGVDWKNPDTFTGNYIVTKGTLTTYNADAGGRLQAEPSFQRRAGWQLGVDRRRTGSPHRRADPGRRRRASRTWRR